MNFYGNFEEKLNDNNDKTIFEKHNKVVGQMTNVHSIDFDKDENMYISVYLPNEGNNNLGLIFAPKSCQGSCNNKDIEMFSGFKGVSHSYLDIEKENLLVADYGRGETLVSDVYLINLNNLNERKKFQRLVNINLKNLI